MSNKNIFSDKTYAELITLLNDTIFKLENDNGEDLDAAVSKYEQANLIIKEIQFRIEKAEQKITKLK